MLIFLVLPLLCLVSTSANATTIIVTNTSDSGPASLRQALADASDGDTIQFDPALNGQIINLSSGELVIDRSIAINGPGSDLLAVSRLSGTKLNFRIFHVMPGHNVTLEGLTISNGVTDFAASAGGGGILNEEATLSIANCIIQHNENNTSYGGGGISNTGLSAILTLSNSTVRDNTLFSGNGAGINNSYGRLIVVQSTIRDNDAAALFLFNGGGIFNEMRSFMTINNSIITGNHAGQTGGGIASHGTVTITDTVVSNNVAVSGGGINHFGDGLTIVRCTISGNMATSSDFGDGGGIRFGNSTSPSPLTITDSTISNNQADTSGGGIAESSGITIITGSTISGNHAGSASISNSGIAGGVHCGDTVIIQNSTLSNNSCLLDGAAIFNSWHLFITSSTISDNMAGRNGNGLYNDANASAQITNSIFKTGASGVNIWNNGGTVTSHGYNLTSDNGGDFFNAIGDLTNTDPMLGPLQSNGGLTFTRQLLAGSPAINAGNPSFTPPPFNDQRGVGYERIVNGRIDIGSFELSAPVPTPTPSSTPVPSPARLGNISTRLEVEFDYVSIAGFIIDGTAPKTVVIRGIGPSLGAFGVGRILGDPYLALRDSNGALIMQNLDWTDDLTQAAALAALGLAPQNGFESAILATLDGNGASYTAILAPSTTEAGVGLVEVYDVNSGVASQLANISTRGLVWTNDDVMIGGFILSGGGPTQVVLRGIGPSLTQFGVPDALADPTLELRDNNGALLIANDNWQDDPASAEQLIEYGFAPKEANESGIFVELQPGLYTAILAGMNGGRGVGLVEIYNLN